MHVCLIFAALGLGGAESQFEQYVRHRPEEVQVTVLYFNNLYDTRSDSLVERLRSAGAAVQFVDLRKATIQGIFRLIGTLRGLRPDVVHTVLAGSAGTWGRLAALLAGVPAIIHSDRSLKPPVTTAQRLLRPILDRRTNRILVNSDAIARWLSESGVPPQKITVIGNGIDFDRFHAGEIEDQRKRWAIPEGVTVAGFLGKLRPEKRLDLLLNAVLQVPEADRPDYLLVGGDGPTKAQADQIIASDPWLRRHVKLCGLVQDVPGFLATIDYLVLTSDREGLPNVVLEAMAMGKPVVATRVSDVPALIEGVGILAEPGSIASIADAISAMQAMSAEKRRELGRSARAKVLTRLEISNVANAFWQVHQEVNR